MAGSPQHATLVPDEVATFSFDEDFPRVEVLQLDGTPARIYWRADGVDPVVAGDGCHVVPAAIGGLVRRVRTSGPTEVRLICAAVVDVCVTGLLTDD